MEHIKIALSILRANKLFVKEEKCAFGQEEVKYLGHVISRKGVAVDPEKIDAMLEWPKPTTVKALRGFLGLTGYYRKFIQDYGKIARPLTEMLKKGSFKWSLQAEESFERLKEAMTKAPVLALPDFNKPFIVECDAPGSGIGGILKQEKRPIAFFSHALQGKTLFLSTYEKEMMALVFAVQKWRPYLLGRKFVVRTDQRSLRHLWEQKITTTAQEKWLVKLMGYDFTIEYKKGKENLVADALSRRNASGVAAISTPVPNWLDPIKDEVQSNQTMQELVGKCEQDEAVGPWEFKDGILYFKNKIYLRLDSSLIPVIVEEMHSSTHEGYHKTLQRARSVFYWQGMRSSIREFIKQCDTCQRNKGENTTPAGLNLSQFLLQVWTDISMDFIDGLPKSSGKTTIFVIVDRLSKFAHFIPISHPYTATTIAQIFFDQIFKLYGMPQSVVCDRDPTFTSLFWRELFRLQGTSFNFSSSYHPQTDGQTEVVNRTVEMYLRCFTSHNQKEWVRWIPWATCFYQKDSIRDSLWETTPEFIVLCSRNHSSGSR